MASPVDIIGIVGCYDIVILSLVMTAYWDVPLWYGTLMYMVTGEFPYAWIWDWIPWDVPPL